MHLHSPWRIQVPPEGCRLQSEDAVLEQAHQTGIVLRPAVRNTWCTTACLCSSSGREPDQEQERDSSLTDQFIQQTPSLYEPQCPVGTFGIVSQGSSWMITVNQIRRFPSTLICDLSLNQGECWEPLVTWEEKPAFGISRHWSHLEFQIPNKN